MIVDLQPLGTSLYLTLALVFGVAAAGYAQEANDTPLARPGGAGVVEEFVPLVKPVMNVRMASSSIRVDGELDEAAWNSATWVTNFTEIWPGNLAEPEIESKAAITYDQSNLYVAFKVYDDPNSVRRSLTDRDKIWNDDYVAIAIDTYGSAAWAYLIASNAIGVQGDKRVTGDDDDDDESFDIVYSSNGRVTDFGYQVEMAIPFRSLRFPSNAEQEWNINFEVSHPRSMQRTYSWSAIGQDEACVICEYGTLGGMRDVRSASGSEFLPALVGSQGASLTDSDNPNSGFDNHSAEVEPSLGLKYSFNSNLVTDITLNPDFSQVEADDELIDVNESFALFFPEKRPFFQEGSDLYQTPIQTVYTRSINNPSLAAKLTGRSSSASVGYIGASDSDSPVMIPLEESSEFVTAGRSFSNIGRFKQTFGSGNYIGGQLTDRRFDGGGSGSTVSTDGQLRFRGRYSLSWQLAVSNTEEPNDPTITEDIDDIEELTFDNGQHTVAFDGESFSGMASEVAVRRQSRNWNFRASYTSLSPEFRADNGFVTQSNRNRLFTWQNYSFWPEGGFFEQIRPHTFFGYEWDYAGQRRDVYYWLGAMIRAKGQTTLGFSQLLFSNEVFKGIDFRGLQRLWSNLESNFSERFNFNTQFQIGEWIAKGEDIPVMGTGLATDVGLVIRPSSQFQVEPNLAYSRLDNQETGESIFEGYIVRLRSNYQFSRRLFVRLIAQYNDFDQTVQVDPLITYRVNPFTAFFVGSTHDYENYEDFNGGFQPTDRQFFFKIQYLVRS